MRDQTISKSVETNLKFSKNLICLDRLRYCLVTHYADVIHFKILKKSILKSIKILYCD